jgi:hypothetical protein
MFLLNCKVVPVPNGPQTAFAGAFGGVWVWTDSEDRVDGAAEEYLFRYGWMIEERRGIHEVSLDQAQRDPIHHAHYLKAQQNGAAAELSTFVGYAK